MTISLITPSFNAAKTIKKTLESVASQTQPVFEYLVIDGASKDETISIARSFSDKLNLKIISEPDKGIYDAMNKGIKLATGEIVSILNADDYFYSPDVLAKVAAMFDSDPAVQVIYGDIIYRNAAQPDKVVRHWRAGNCSNSKIRNGWIMPHPAVFVRRSLYQSGGVFNDQFRIAGDYELMLRWFLVIKIKALYLPETLTVMGVGGASGRDLKQRWKGWQELKKAWRINNLALPCCFIFRRIFFKLRQLKPLA